jgi:hypothetical protein
MKTFILSVMAIVLSATVCLAEEKEPLSDKRKKMLLKIMCEQYPKRGICKSEEKVPSWAIADKDSSDWFTPDEPTKKQTERNKILLQSQIRALCKNGSKISICTPSKAILNNEHDKEEVQRTIELYPISNVAINLLRDKPSTAVVFDAIYGGGDECQFIECLDIPEGYTIRETEEEKVARLFEDYQKGINVFCDKNSDLKDCWSPERLANEVVTGGKFITKIDKNFIMTHKNTVYICSMWYMDKVDKVQCHINPDE